MEVPQDRFFVRKAICSLMLDARMASKAIGREMPHAAPPTLTLTSIPPLPTSFLPPWRQWTVRIAALD